MYSNETFNIIRSVYSFCGARTEYQLCCGLSKAVYASSGYTESVGLENTNHYMKSKKREKLMRHGFLGGYRVKIRVILVCGHFDKKTLGLYVYRALVVANVFQLR